MVWPRLGQVMHSDGGLPAVSSVCCSGQEKPGDPRDLASWFCFVLVVPYKRNRNGEPSLSHRDSRSSQGGAELRYRRPTTHGSQRYFQIGIDLSVSG